MSEMKTAYVAVGSNLGDRRALISSAVAALARHDGIEVKAVSSIIETAPLGRPAQGPYLNAVIRLQTSLQPHALLGACQQIETEHGRDRAAEQRWGPRRLDLDILLYGEATIDEPDLAVPHPRMHERAFVLDPLAELAPALVHPVLGRSMTELRDALRAGDGEVEGETVRRSGPKPPETSLVPRR
ncbi:MAG: 2-amino-4-hydroxy-6-hydroxymethyldihydropteridine diphosphokinase [Planctomycetota bacterium]|nr:2-amino-4-hydroxy-6-hydroxymethyldihydropteridine diphosphokinase [Planctomycetota bacterium]